MKMNGNVGVVLVETLVFGTQILGFRRTFRTVLSSSDVVRSSDLVGFPKYFKVHNNFAVSKINSLPVMLTVSKLYQR